MSVTLFFIVIVLIIMPYTSHGHEVYYVDNVQGDDANSGIQSDPWRSLNYAAKQLVAGDHLIIVSHGPIHPYREQLYFHDLGDELDTIEISGGSGDSDPILVGLDDWTDLAAGGEQRWVVRGKNWILHETMKASALWLSQVKKWEESGVYSLTKRVQSIQEKKLLPGQWYYDEASRYIKYRSMEGETLSNMHIEGLVRRRAIGIVSVQNLELKNITTMFTENNAISIVDDSRNISVSQVTVRYAGNNGISIARGGSDIVIEFCNISDVMNNGIMIGGGGDYPIKNTIVRGCSIQYAQTNDGITLHDDLHGNPIGYNHLIEGNTISGCGEQGIDIVSGHQIVARNNLTFDNHDSAISVGHGAKDVRIERHVSIDDGHVGGLVVGTSSAVVVRNSLFANGKYHQIVIRDASDVVFENNTVIQGKSGQGSVIDMQEKSKRVLFRRNIIISQVRDKGVRLVRFLKGWDRAETDTIFDDNIWWVEEASGKEFFVKRAGKFKLDEFKKVFGLKDNGLFLDPGVRFVENSNKLFRAASDYDGYGCDCKSLPVLQ